MSSPVVTRFAPSPTGFLHIGGARTALFNWALAKANGGTMLLRIEDTDRARSSSEAVTAIIDGLTWLGLDWHGEAVSQFARSDRHRAVVAQLLASGNAYKCYCSPEDLTAMREAARAEGRPIGYDGTWRERDPGLAPAGVEPVVRFKSPMQGQTVIEDCVQGRVVFQNKDLDDLVIARSDGSPTYNLSVVVDDHDMAITHVVRGVDHLTNAARQAQIYQAMDWAVPNMAHIPLIHGPDGAKLSKRHGALGVDAYRDMGYLPTAMRNYLARLGWSHGDDEIFSTDQLIRWFTLSGVGKSPARFDFAKLEHLNGHYLRTMDASDLLAELENALLYLAGGKEILGRLDGEMRAKMLAALPGLRDRANTLVELIEGSKFLFAVRPICLDERAKKLLNDDSRSILKALHGALAVIGNWDIETLEAVVKQFAEAEELKLGKVAQPLRAAVTGTTVSPGIFDVLAALGRDEVMARISDQFTVSPPNGAAA